MEKLQQYLAKRHKGEFAASIGTSPSYLSQLLSGHRKPSFRLMLEIETATGGVVSLRSWATDYEERR